MGKVVDYRKRKLDIIDKQLRQDIQDELNDLDIELLMHESDNTIHYINTGQAEQEDEELYLQYYGEEIEVDPYEYQDKLSDNVFWDEKKRQHVYRRPNLFKRFINWIKGVKK